MTISRADHTEDKPENKPPVYKRYSYVNQNVPVVFSDYDAKRCHHPVYIITKPPVAGKQIIRWFCITMIGDTREKKKWYAVKRTVAGELLRFFMPWHPRTRTCITPDNIYVLSEAVPEFSDLVDEARKVDSTAYHQEVFAARRDLAKILVLSLFLGEFDLRERNVGFGRDVRMYRRQDVDATQKRMTRIDTEVCFAELHARFVDKTLRHDFTVEDLKNLLRFSHFKPTNWLHFGAAFSVTLLSDPDFQHAVNQSILEILQLPDSFFETFVGCYTDNLSTAEQLSKVLMARREMLFRAAIQLDTFRLYLITQQAIQDRSDFRERLNGFTTMQKYSFNRLMPTLPDQMQAKWLMLVGAVVITLLQEHQFELVRLLVEQNPTMDLNYWSQNGTGNNAIHLAVMQPSVDVRLLSAFCNARVLFGRYNLLGKSELALATEARNYSAIRFLLKKASRFYGWTEIKLAIDCMLTENMQHGLNTKLEWIRYLSCTDLRVNRVELQHYGRDVVCSLINQAIERSQVLVLIQRLQVMENQKAFLRVVYGDARVEAVQPSLWTQIIIHAKQKVLTIARQENNFDRDEEVLALLRIPTSYTWLGMFSYSPPELEEYIRLGDNLNRGRRHSDDVCRFA